LQSSGKEIGDRAGNEFYSLNSLLNLNDYIEDSLGTDYTDFYHQMLGLDSPKLGIQSPALNLSIPIKSL
jgi:hypothetical protein